MDRWKKILWKLLFPETIWIFLLFNVSIGLVLYIFLGKKYVEVVSYVFYALSAYTLTVVCARMPGHFKKIKKRIYSNKYAKRYLTDKDLRIRVSLYGGLVVNVCFAVFKIVMGILFQSKWLFAMAGYNMILSVMRFVLVYKDQISKKVETEQERKLHGIHSYKVCGWLMLLLNMAISVIVIIVVFEEQTLSYPGFMIYAIAAFTFYCMITAIISMVKYWHRVNPIFSAVKRIGMAKALVSVFTLQVAMLTQFGVDDEVKHQMMNGMTGFAVCLIITVMAIFMLVDVKKDFAVIKE